MIKTVNLQKVFRTEEVETWALNDVSIEIKQLGIKNYELENTSVFGLIELKCSKKSKYFDFLEHFSNFVAENLFDYEAKNFRIIS